MRVGRIVFSYQNMFSLAEKLVREANNDPINAAGRRGGEWREMKIFLGLMNSFDKPVPERMCPKLEYLGPVVYKFEARGNFIAKGVGFFKDRDKKPVICMPLNRTYTLLKYDAITFELPQRPIEKLREMFCNDQKPPKN